MRVSAVIPVHNAATTIEDLVNELGEVLARCTERHEIILVDDGSSDASWSLIDALAGARVDVVAIRLARNSGAPAALLCGIRQARYEVTVTLDDDFQHPPTEVPHLLDALGHGAHLAYGVPSASSQALARRALASLWKAILQWALGVPEARKLSSFRAFHTDLRNAFSEHQGPAFFLDALLAWGTSQVVYVTVRHDARRAGSSTYSVWRLIHHTINMIVSYSTAPLRLAWLFAGSLMLLSLVFLGGGLLLADRDDAGYWLLAGLLSLLAAVQAVLVAIAGEYLSRVFGRLSGQPSYVVTDVRPEPGHRGRSSAPTQGRGGQTGLPRGGVTSDLWC